MTDPSIIELASAVQQFKSDNDARLAEIEKKGAADVVLTEKVDRINSEISQLSTLVQELEKKAARPMLDAQGREVRAESVEHRKAFNQYLRKGVDSGLADLERKALSTTVGTDGGFTVPEQIDAVIQGTIKEVSPLRQICNVVTVGTSDYKKLVNQHGTASGWVGETAARPETTSPNFAEIVPPMGEVYANPGSTQIMLDDSSVDVEAWLGAEIALEFAKAEGAAFISGSGVNRPRGFLATGTPVATADATRAFGQLQFIASGQAAALPTSADVYINMVSALKAGHRQNSNWITSKIVLGEIRKFKDTTGRYLWEPSLQAGRPDTLLGYPVVEAEDMPAVAANAFPLAFGNFRAGYTIVDRLTGTTILRDPFTNKPYVMFYATKRVGGAVVDSEAIKLLRIQA